MNKDFKSKFYLLFLEKAVGYTLKDAINRNNKIERKCILMHRRTVLNLAKISIIVSELL